MACTNPKPAWKILMPDGKYKIKFISHFDTGNYEQLKSKFGDDLLMIPCGHCDSCIEQRTKSWAIRCSLEAGQYEQNCFITLTYNDKCLPKNGLCKKDLQKFIKRLRNTYGEGIRYFAIGEYGTKFDRPHYHLIVFNFFPGDAVIAALSPYGGFYYKSKELQNLWKFGFVSVGEVSYNSCAYVARYCQKKIKDMGIVRKNPEFSLMSRRPGIGYNYFRDHFESLIATDKIYASVNGKYVLSSFRYFDKLIEQVDPDKLQELKNKRICSSVYNVANELLSRSLPNMESYLIFLENETAKKYDRLKRRIA